VPFDIQTRQFTRTRPYPILAGRMHMNRYTLHHRIPWNLLLNVLQRALDGTVHPRVIGYLLTLAPRPTVDLATQFAAAAHQVRTQRPFRPGQGEVIVEVEQELFSLPCNLFQGLGNRADDPGNDKMDFTPSDVQNNGALPEGIPGTLERARERVFGILCQLNIDPGTIQIACRNWRDLWIAHGGGLHCATEHQHHWWAPGGMPFTDPPYRHWLNPVGAALTVEECLRLNELVFRRATTGG
jgi:hypothetical protein